MRLKAIFLFCILNVGCDDIAAPGNQHLAWKLTPCPGFTETGKPPLVSGAECGVLEVDENPQAENSKKIGLNILRLPAINPVPKEDPLFIIAGGPGQAAVGVAEQLFYVFEEVRKSRDIVFVDQRGTGKSQPLECPDVAKIVQRLTFADQKSEIKLALRQCADSYGESLQFYTTPYAVDDLDRVRHALGYQQINLWGVSYGTRVALEYMKRYPKMVRTSVLDGVAPVSMALPWSAESDAMAALSKINEQCSALSVCHDAYGNLIEKAESVARRLQLSAVDVEIEHPSTRLIYQVKMNHEVFAGAVRMTLYSRDLVRLLPLAISRAYDEDYQLLTAIVAMAERRNGFGEITIGMHYNILCNEDYPQYTSRNFSDSQKFLLLNAIQTASEACEMWPRYQLSGIYFKPVSSDVPTLLLSGARDPVTPPFWAEQAMVGLSRAKHAIAPGGHHSITRDGCTARLIAQFIATGNIAQLDVSCVERIMPLPPYYELSADALATLEDEQLQAGSDN
jgi:pimeloyl-ACP methyl ester carboxylesterase